MEIQQEQTNIVDTQNEMMEKNYKTPSYTRRAVAKYQEKNKEKLNEYAKNKWREKYENDPEFREKQKKRLMERYYRKKQEQQLNKKN
jgi:hypothetical protein